MKKRWQTADIIDLYALLQMDEEERRAGRHTALAQRDRTIYLAEITNKQGNEAKVENSSFLAQHWLSARRQMLDQDPNSPPLPGKLWQEALGFARGLLVIFGLLCGIGVAGGFLVYSGSAPLNVAAFFALFVLLPLLLLLLQFFFFFIRLLRKQPVTPGGLSAVIGRLLIRGMQRLQKKFQQTASAKTRLSSAALIGRLSTVLRQSPEQTSLLLWPAFILLQWSVIGFSLGVLGTTMAKVVFSDIAFAWQSSLQVSPELVFQLAQWIALPWSDLPHAYPDLAQIQGSQLIFKEGISHLTTEDLRSWWPFLCLGITFYALLPRLLLVMLGCHAERRNLEQLVHKLPEVKRIASRMLQPQLDTSRSVTKPEQADQTPSSLPVPQPQASPAPAQTTAISPLLTTISSLALIPEEILEDCPASCLEGLRDLLSARQIGVTPLIHIGDIYDGTSLSSLLAGLLPPDGQPPGQILLLQEAWQPPIREHESLIRALRTQLGPESDILILLLGKPNPSSILTPAAPAQVQIWQQKMQALADANLFVHPLISS